jgi:hypothetical protein
MTYTKPPSIWSTIPGLFEALGKCISDKWSARQTADELSIIAGQPISRNACISKALRSGIPNFQSVEVGKYPRKPKQSRKSHQVPINITRQKVPSIDLPDELPLPADFLGLSLMELPKHGCRYPSGDGPFFFCGQQQWADSSYCGHHHRICTTFARCS